MNHLYSKDRYTCPHCYYEGLMIYGDSRVVEGEKWDFYRCPRCYRWVAIKEGTEPKTIYQLWFRPLNLNDPLK